MKTNLRILLTFLALGSIAASAQELTAFWPIQEPALSQLGDFKSRLQAAIESGEAVNIKALYQTNGATGEELNSELVRWQPMVAQHGETISFYFKELSKLPQESQAFWSTEARRLTEHPVTHFALVRCGTAQLTVPLILADNKLLIVPSEKVIEKGSQPDGAANRNPPVRPETNRPSAAVGSGR
jgi:hypothetical protein